MKHWIVLVGLALAALALPGCSSLPFMGPGSMDVTLRGVELDGVVSVYVIVGDEAELTDIDDPRTIDKVVDPKRHDKYLSFGQFKAEQKDKTWVFQQRALRPNHPLVDIVVAKKSPTIEVEIDRELLEAHPQLSAAFVVNCGSQGWGAYPRITAAQIANTGSMELDLRGPTISLHGQGEDAAIPPIGTPR
jgi:hypothetical protein